jgi:hypothetical protein
LIHGIIKGLFAKFLTEEPNHGTLAPFIIIIYIIILYYTRKYARALHRDRKLILGLGATGRENSYHNSAQCIFYHFLPHSVILFGTCISKHFCP